MRIFAQRPTPNRRHYACWKKSAILGLIFNTPNANTDRGIKFADDVPNIQIGKSHACRSSREFPREESSLSGRFFCMSRATPSGRLARVENRRNVTVVGKRLRPARPGDPHLSIYDCFRVHLYATGSHKKTRLRACRLSQDRTVLHETALLRHSLRLAGFSRRESPIFTSRMNTTCAVRFSCLVADRRQDNQALRTFSSLRIQRRSASIP